MSQLLTIAKTIRFVFDTSLRQSLKYESTYSYNINHINNSIDYMSLNGIDGLYNILKADSNILENVRQKIKNGLRKYLEISDVQIFLLESGPFVPILQRLRNSIIRIQLIINSFELSNISDIGIYVNIVSNLNLDELDDFCKNDKKYNEICINQEFWSQLFFFRFPNYTYKNLSNILDKEKINYKQLYKGILYYEKNKYNIYKVINKLFKFSFDSLIFLTYINNIVEKDIINNIELVYKYSNVNYLNIIYKLYPNLFSVDKIEEFIYYIVNKKTNFSLEKYIWLINKPDILHVDINLYLLEYIENLNLFEELLHYLPNNIDSKKITSIIKDRHKLFNDNNPDYLITQSSIFEKYKDYIKIDDLKDIITTLLS